MQKLIWQNSNGEIINLTGGSYGITSWEGFSNTSLNIQSQQVPFQDGGVFLDALIDQRELSVTLAMQDNGNLEERYRMRRELIHILNPKLGEGYLIYTNDFTSKRIKCIAQIPLFENHNSNDSGTPKASLSWTACEPYWEDVFDIVIPMISGKRLFIQNDGDIACSIRADLFTNNVVNPQLINFTNNKKIELNGSFQEEILINTEIGNKTIKTESLGLETLCYFSSDYFDIKYINSLGFFIRVGVYAIETSFDGLTWVNRQTGNIFRAVAWSERLKCIVVVGQNGVILTSPDGINWTNRVSGTTYSLNSVIYIDSLQIFVAVGGSSILTSSDSVTWVDRSSFGWDFKTVCYSNSLNLIVTYREAPGLQQIITSSDGVNWSTYDFEGTPLKSITFSEEIGLFAACGNSGRIYTSADAVHWIQRESGIPSQKNLLYIRYFKDLHSFAAVGEQGSITRSSNGISWTGEELYLLDFNSIDYSESLGLFVINGYYSTFRSSDGEIWTETSTSTEANEYFFDVVYARNQKIFVAVGEWHCIRLSVDGKSWSDRVPGISNDLRTIAYSDELNLFVTAGKKGIIYSSPDAVNWTSRTSGVNISLVKIIYITDLHLFVIVGQGGTILISHNGIDWIVENSGTSEHLLSICYSADLQMIVIGGQSGVLLTSHNGINWTIVNTGVYSSNAFVGVAYSENLKKFFAISGQGLILRSKDGVRWENLENNLSSTINEIRGFIYSEDLGLFVFAGYINNSREFIYFFTSPDCVSWSNKSCGLNLNIESCIYVSSLQEFYLVGSSETTLKTIFEESKNLISYLTEESDMTFVLEQGKNNIMITKTEGELNGVIRYRQKYIGV